LHAFPTRRSSDLNTVGATLAPMLVTGYLEQISNNQVSSTPTGQDNERVLGTNHQGRILSVLVAAHGSSTGFRTLANGQADIWASSRPVKKGEADAVKDKADLTALASEHVIATDG